MATQLPNGEQEAPINISNEPVSLPNPPQILGLSRTSKSFCQKYINSNNVPKPSEVKNFAQLMIYQNLLKKSLDNSGLFKKVEVSCNTIASNENEAIETDKVGVVVKVEERNFISGQVGADMGASGGNVEPKVEFSLNNFGGGEKFSFMTNKNHLAFRFGFGWNISKYFELWA